MKPVEGFEGLYSVDEHGNVYSHPKKVKIGNKGAFRKQGFKKLNQYSMRYGHLRVYLAKNGKKYPKLVHRLVAHAFIPNTDNEPIINHIDCNPQNNHVSNLEWCSHKHNSLHAYQNNLNGPPEQKGSKNSNSKLTDEDVLKMRSLYSSGLSAPEITKLFPVGYSCVYDVVNNKSWKHLI